MKDLGTLAKKYLFPILVIITGLYLVIMGAVPDSQTGISQNSSFLYGGLTILALGVLILLFVMDIIKNRKIQIILYAALLAPLCIVLINSLYSSVNETIVQIETKKHKDVYIKQALNDIKDIELEYRKKYGWYTNDFNELKRFLLIDSVYSIDTEGDIPDYAITQEHQAILGYNSVDNYIEIESYDEEEAIKCGLIKKDTNWTNVLVKLFTGEEAINNERIYPFDIESFEFVPLTENISFSLAADVLESDDESFDFAYNRKGTNEFVSSQLVDKEENQKMLYQLTTGIVLNDTLTAFNELQKNDVVTAINNQKIESVNGLSEMLKTITTKDTLTLQITRVDSNQSASQFTNKIAVNDLKSNKRKTALSIAIYLEEKFSPLKYNAKDFYLVNIANEFTQKESELSKSYLDTSAILKFTSYREKYNNTTYEYEKNKLYSQNNPAEKFIQFFTTSKIGTPVFTAFDPKPYDPLNERDTLRVGSLTDVKTNGNWDE